MKRSFKRLYGDCILEWSILGRKGEECTQELLCPMVHRTAWGGCLLLHVSWWNQCGCCVDLVDFRTQHQQECHRAWVVCVWHRLEMTCFGVLPTLIYQSHTELAAAVECGGNKCLRPWRWVSLEALKWCISICTSTLFGSQSFSTFLCPAPHSIPGASLFSEDGMLLLQSHPRRGSKSD